MATNRIKVVMFICAHSCIYSHNAWVENSMASLHKYTGNTSKPVWVGTATRTYKCDDLYTICSILLTLYGSIAVLHTCEHAALPSWVLSESGNDRHVCMYV